MGLSPSQSQNYVTPQIKSPLSALTLVIMPVMPIYLIESSRWGIYIKFHIQLMQFHVCYQQLSSSYQCIDQGTSYILILIFNAYKHGHFIQLVHVHCFQNSIMLRLYNCLVICFVKLFILFNFILYHACLVPFDVLTHTLDYIFSCCSLRL